MGNCLTAIAAAAASTPASTLARTRSSRRESSQARRIDDGGAGRRRDAVMREDALHVLPGRIFSNEGRSSVASIYTQQGCKGINQDAMILWEVSQSKIRIASCYHRSITLPPIVISSRGLVGLGLIYVYVFDPGLRWSRRRPLRCVRRPRPPRPLGGPQGPGRPPPQAPLSSPLFWRWPQPYGPVLFLFREERRRPGTGSRLLRGGAIPVGLEGGLREVVQGHGQGAPFPSVTRLFLQWQHRRDLAQAGLLFLLRSTVIHYLTPHTILFLFFHLIPHSLFCFCSQAQGSNLFIANIGDSRAVLGCTDDNNSSMLPVQLTVDLKPDLPSMQSF